jgi:hypothetical protein
MGCASAGGWTTAGRGRPTMVSIDTGDIGYGSVTYEDDQLNPFAATAMP